MSPMQKVLDIINDYQETSIEMDEEFEIHGYPNEKFRFSVCGLWQKFGTVSWKAFNGIAGLLNGDFKIKVSDKMWKPKYGDTYYTPSLCDSYKYEYNCWSDYYYEEYVLNNGLVFKTQEEAIAMTDKLLEYVKELRKGE